jgi:hypothetical protein
VQLALTSGDNAVQARAPLFTRRAADAAQAAGLLAEAEALWRQLLATLDAASVAAASAGGESGAAGTIRLSCRGPGGEGERAFPRPTSS